jgi:sulfatase maturation enzyme AslB (radical SAM superfamily)
LRKECLDIKEMISCCYRSYYKMAITPSRGGDAIVATCWNNIFRRENTVIIKENMKNAWNSREFRFQRKLISQGDWSCCKGANCACDPFGRESKFLNAPDVKDAIAAKKESLAYGPKLIVIIPSHGCNCDCYSCFQARIKNKRIKYSLRDDLLKEIEETIVPSAEYVIISGGEPFFIERSRGFIDWIAAHYPDKHVAINTNGSLLHEYGLDRIMKNDFFLTISLYGMNADTYREVTKRDYFDIVFRNLRTLIEHRYKKMKVSFLLTDTSSGDAEKFCEFIAGIDGLNGLVRNNWYDGVKFWGLMRRLEEKYSGVSSRLRFEYQSESLLKVICRKWYNPVHSLRYLVEANVNEM